LGFCKYRVGRCVQEEKFCYDKGSKKKQEIKKLSKEEDLWYIQETESWLRYKVEKEIIEEEQKVLTRNLRDFNPL